MVRLSVIENGASLAFQDSELTFMVGMITASISMMAIVIFACAKSSTKRKNKNNPYSTGGSRYGGGGDKTSVKTVVIGESNKAQKTRATSDPARSAGEITTFVDIPDTDDGKDTRCRGIDTTKICGDDGGKNNDVSNGRTDDNYISGDNNNNMGGSHTHVSTNTASTGGDGGHHHGYTSTGNTGGGWTNDHGGSSWSAGDHGAGGFSGGGGDTGGFSGGGW